MVFKVIKLINFFRELENYTGAQAEIKKSIENPNSSEIKEHAWSTLLPLVAKLKKFWKFSINLSQSYTALIRELTSDDDNATKVITLKIYFNKRSNLTCHDQRGETRLQILFAPPTILYFDTR